MKHLARLFLLALGLLAVLPVRAQLAQGLVVDPNSPPTLTVGQTYPVLLTPTGALFTNASGGGGGGGGDASAANQLTGNASLATIATEITTLDAKVNQGVGDMATGVRTTSAEARSVVGASLNAPALNRELLTNTDNGWYDAKDFNSASLTVVTGAGISAGVLTFEATDDVAVAGQLQPVRVGNTVTTAPITTLTLSASAINRYTLNLTARYFRVRVSTAVVGGTVQAYATLRQQVFIDSNSLAAITGSISPGNASGNLGKAEDGVANTGDTGVFMLGVRRDSLTTSTAATARYGELSQNRFGATYTAAFRTAMRTYSATASITAAASATDIAAIFGNATTTVNVTKIRISGIQTTTGTVEVLAIRRSTANSGGTSSNFSVAQHDASDPANSSTPIAYTANPTPGTAAGTLRRQYLPVGSAASGLSGDYIFEFGENGKPIVLSGTAQGMAINLNGVTVTGGVFTVTIEWGEF
jgi:hypothetical protein